MYKIKRIINFVRCIMNTFIIVFCLVGKHNKPPERGNHLILQIKTGIRLVVHRLLKFLYFQIKLMVMQKKYSWMLQMF